MATRSNKNLSQFKSRLIGGGARPNLFEVELTTFPEPLREGWDSDTFQFMCKSAALPASYMTNATVYQLGRGKEPSSRDNSGQVNAVLAQYNFIDIFPTNVSQIDLSYDNGDQIEEFTVEFQVNSWSRGELSVSTDDN